MGKNQLECENYLGYYVIVKWMHEVLVVYAKTDPNNPKPQHGITCFLIEKVRVL